MQSKGYIEDTLDSPPSRRKASPAAEVFTANEHFHNNDLVCYMLILDLDFQIRQPDW
jgi:hypothetical protein